MSTESWKQIRLPAFQGYAGSNETYELDRSHWPSWAHGSTQFERIFVYCPDYENQISSQTTASIVGRLLTERYDIKDQPKPYNYNFYMLVLSTGGQVYQSPPIVTSSPPHHSSEPASWLNAYGPPPV